MMLRGENSRTVVEAAKEKLVEIEASLPPGVKLDIIYDRSELINRTLHTVLKNLLEGGTLVIVILFLMLGNFRAGLIVALAIPLSMLFASNFMMVAGISASLMSLGAIDFGLIVDSSVIMIENCIRAPLRKDAQPSGGPVPVRSGTNESHQGRGDRSSQADHVWRIDYRRGLPADFVSRRHRRQAVSANGIDRAVCTGWLFDPLDDANAGARLRRAASKNGRTGKFSNSQY